jgi:hypothetical protein
MKKLKSAERIQLALNGLIPFEDLTDKELRKLERMVFDAIARKKNAPILPPTSTRH